MGVYEPAMSRKMLAWSIRLRRILARGDQSNRWYTAETPNRSSDDATNTAHAIFAAAPSATAMSTMPSTRATGVMPACSQPRHVGLGSGPASCASSTSGRCTTCACSSSDASSGLPSGPGAEASRVILRV